MSTSRRKAMNEELKCALNSTLDQLEALWEEIGIVNEQQTARVGVVMHHVRAILTSMVSEEENLKEKLLKNTTDFGAELIKLCHELHKPPHVPPTGLSILKLEHHLRTTVDDLLLEKHERMKQVHHLKKKDQQLCDCLHTTPYYIPSGTVPSAETIEELKRHVKESEAEKESRFKLFKTTKTKIVQFLDDLEKSPNTSLEKEIVLEEEDCFPLSSDNMRALKRYHDELDEKSKRNFAQASQLREQLESLWEKINVPQEERQNFSSAYTGFKPSVIDKLKEELERCEVLKLENMSSVIAGTRKELQEWWDKCFYSTHQKKQFKYFTTEECTEDILTYHEEEVEKVKAYYRQNEDLLEKVARRQKLWGEFLEFERKAADPLRFGNRGCNLLKEEKARKKLLKELPKVEDEVKEQIALWEQEHGKAFFVAGHRFSDFITKQWEDYRADKENEKQQRSQKKAKEMEEEMIYGSKPVTPGKRRFIGTPARTPNKLRKINDTTKTPNSVSRLQHRSNFNSVFHSPSVVPRSTGPKTPAGRYAQPLKHTPARRPLNTPANNRTQQQPKNETFSQTQLAGPGTSTPTGSNTANPDVSDVSSLASLANYQDFAKGLNHNSRDQCRSSMMPDKKPNY